MGKGKVDFSEARAILLSNGLRHGLFEDLRPNRYRRDVIELVHRFCVKFPRSWLARIAGVNSAHVTLADRDGFLGDTFLKALVESGVVPESRGRERAAFEVDDREAVFELVDSHCDLLGISRREWFKLALGYMCVECGGDSPTPLLHKSIGEVSFWFSTGTDNRVGESEDGYVSDGTC